MRADLHLHSTASDGKLSPEELVHRAARQGLSHIALTDHDSVDGIPLAIEAARAYPGLTVIPGVEIGTDIPHGEVHILGYFVDYRSSQLESTLARLRSGRKDRALKMIAKLRGLGLPVEWTRVQELAGEGAIGRPHIALAMLEKGYVATLKEAFIKYIGRDGPAYAEREKLSPEGAVDLVTQSGGLAVLAHPAELESAEALLLRLKRAGLVGLEAYYNGYAPDVVSRLVALAAKYDLIPGGGSDYHGLDSRAETPLGGVQVPQECLERLLALAVHRG